MANPFVASTSLRRDDKARPGLSPGGVEQFSEARWIFLEPCVESKVSLAETTFDRRQRHDLAAGPKPHLSIEFVLGGLQSLDVIHVSRRARGRCVEEEWCHRGTFRSSGIESSHNPVCYPDTLLEHVLYVTPEVQPTVDSYKIRVPSELSIYLSKMLPDAVPTNFQPANTCFPCYTKESGNMTS